jgi:hypothetical protein
VRRQVLLRPEGVSFWEWLTPLFTVVGVLTSEVLAALAGAAVDQLAGERTVWLRPLELSKPGHNACGGSLQGWPSDECLDRYSFVCLDDAPETGNLGGKMTRNHDIVMRCATDRPKVFPGRSKWPRSAGRSNRRGLS